MAAVPGFQHSFDAMSEALGCAPASCTPASPASESQARDVAQSALCNPLVLAKELTAAKQDSTFSEHTGGAAQVWTAGHHNENQEADQSEPYDPGGAGSAEAANTVVHGST